VLVIHRTLRYSAQVGWRRGQWEAGAGEGEEGTP